VTTNDHERLELLLDRWESARREGRPVRLPELCADAPELRDLFALRVRVIELAEQYDARTSSIAPSALETAAAVFGDDTSFTTTRDWLAAGDTADGLVLVRLLGQGGMGEVWEATDTRLNRRVAVKFLRPGLVNSETARQRFAREAMACAAVQHENVVAVYTVGEFHGSPYLVMPLLEGETLATRLRREGPLPLAEMARIGRGVASGLAALHARGLTHRDVKPANIWLCSDGTVKLLDLGLALFRDGVLNADATQAFVFAGTPAYMAPEQLDGRAVAPGSDLFSLGVVFAQMASGRNPFAGGSMRESFTNVVNVTPSSPSSTRPELPAAFDDLVLGLLTKNPSDRHPNSAAGVVEWLDDLTAGRPAAAAPVAHTRRAILPWVVGIVAAVLIVVGGVLWAFLTPPSPDEQVRQAARQLREQPVSNFRTAEKTGGVFKNLRHYEFTFNGKTGMPVCSAVKDGTAVITLPYTGEYERNSWDLLVGQRLPITVPETATLGGTLDVTVTVGHGGVRLTGYKLVPTGDVTDPGHDANVSAQAALLTLVRDVLGAE
jgi:tRNA A-37 threonylcarbamoyl transferase component Bud32